MGAGYTQPLRGYQYSHRGSLNSASSSINDDSAREFDVFSDLYLNNFENQKSMTYFLQLSDKTQEVIRINYEQAFNDAQLFYRDYFLNSTAARLAIYASPSYDTQIAIDSAMIFGIHLILSSPEYQSIDQFKASVGDYENLIILCDASKLNQISSKLPGKRIISSPLKCISTNSNQKGEKLALSIPKIDSSLPCITFAQSKITLDHKTCLRILFCWSKCLKICRDSTLSVSLPIGSNLGRIAHMLAIYNRCPISLTNDTKIFNSTHLFVAKQSIENEAKERIINIKNKGVFFKSKFNLFYSWHNFRTIAGSSSGVAERIAFKQIEKSWNPDMFAVIVDGPIDPTYHEIMTLIYRKPISTVYVPEAWGNIGTALPCDIRFTKYGTVGGPVGGTIKSDENKILNVVNEDELEGENNFIQKGVWDEEGSLILL